MPAPRASDPIDVVDTRDRVIGTAPRGAVLGDGRNFRTAHVFVVSREKGLLLQRLANGRERHPRRWGSSAAAYLHAGESYRHAAERRLLEELGLDLELEQVGNVAVRDQNSIKFVALFAGSFDGETVASDLDHVAALRWWPRTEIAETMSTAPDTFTPTLQDLYRFWVGATPG